MDKRRGPNRRPGSKHPDAPRDPWWTKATPPPIWHHNADGYLVHGFDAVADPDPETPGHWLLPRNATYEMPPTPAIHQWPRLVADSWQLVPDYRAVPLWDCGTAQPVQAAIGQTPAELGATETAPPGYPCRWSDEAWQPDFEALGALAKGRIELAFAQGMNTARGDYPEGEVSTWPEQIEQARAALRDEGLAAEFALPTPLLDALAVDRDRLELARTIVAKASAYDTERARLILARKQALAKVDADVTAGDLAELLPLVAAEGQNVNA